MKRLPSVCATAGLVILLAGCAQGELEPTPGLFVVEVASGERRQLGDERTYASPSWSPDSR